MWEEREKDQDHAQNLPVRNVNSKPESNKKLKGRWQMGERHSGNNLETALKANRCCPMAFCSYKTGT